MNGKRVIHIARYALRDLWKWVSDSVRRPENLPAYLNACFTLLLAIFAFMAWDESKRATKAFESQVGEAQKQTIAAQNQLQIAHDAQRPWIQAEVKAAGKFFEDEKYGWQLPVSITLQNSGHQPALHVIVSMEESLPKEYDFLGSGRIDVCHVPDSFKPKGGSTIFPDQTIKGGQKVPLYWGSSLAPYKGNGLLVIGGCVKYWFSSGEAAHTTTFAYVVRRFKEGYMQAQRFPVQLSDVPVDEIDLLPYAGVRTDNFLAD